MGQPARKCRFPFRGTSPKSYVAVFPAVVEGAPAGEEPTHLSTTADVRLWTVANILALSCASPFARDLALSEPVEDGDGRAEVTLQRDPLPLRPFRRLGPAQDALEIEDVPGHGLGRLFGRPHGLNLRRSGPWRC